MMTGNLDYLENLEEVTVFFVSSGFYTRKLTVMRAENWKELWARSENSSFYEICCDGLM